MPPTVGPPRGLLHVPPREAKGSHHRVAPSAQLASHVAHFWAVSWDLRGEPPRFVEALPHPVVHLNFEAGQARVFGVPANKFGRWLRGAGDTFGIKFRPAAFRNVLGASVATLTDRTPSMRTVFGAAGDAWKRGIARANTLEERIAFSESWLAERLSPLSSELEELRDLVERLAIDGSLISVEQVAKVAGVTKRTLERRFLDAVGVSPKWVIRRYRLHEAAELLQKPHAEIADVALRLGYFDQAHFSRDFKAATGKAPGEFLRLRTDGATRSAPSRAGRSKSSRSSLR